MQYVCIDAKMTNDKYVTLEALAGDQYKVSIHRAKGTYVQNILPSEGHALKFIIDHAEPYSKMHYNTDRLEHVFNNALTHIWISNEEEMETYSLPRCNQIIEETHWNPNHPVVEQSVYQKRPLGACSASYVGNPADYTDRAQIQALGETDTLDHLLDDMEYHSPGIGQQLELPFNKK